MIRGGWYLNLPQAADRRAHMERALAGTGLGVERFEALTPQRAPAALRARIAPGSRLRDGEIGCFLSHLAVLQRVAAAPDGYWAVFEDDVVFTGDFAALGRALATCPTPPEVLRLENHPKCASLEVFAAEGFAFRRPLHVPNSSAGYLVTPQGARAVLALAQRVDLPYDQFLRRIGRARVDMLICAPPPILHDVLPSGIGADRRAAGPRRRRAGLTAGEALGFVGRFGMVNFLRLLAAQLRMRLDGVRLDTTGRYVVRERG